jgi:hypothetical protein
MEAQNKDYNVNVIRSVWHRLKKGHIEIRNLEPKKDVKGGAGITVNSKTSQAQAVSATKAVAKPS